MKRAGCKILFRWLAGVLFVAVLAPGSFPLPAAAQTFWSSLRWPIPLDTIESFIGPILPREKIGATFRSEFGTTVAATSLVGARLSGSRTAELDLKNAVPLNGAPVRYDVNANIRLWRFGLRGAYSHFETESSTKNVGEFDMTGPRLGLDLDVIYRTKWALGIAGDFYFTEPKLHAHFQSFPGIDPATALPNEIQGTLNLTGDRPYTLGPYVRLVPPTIIGIPVHIEGFYKAPLNAGGPLNSSSRLLTYGVVFVFRPQIYRFDLACKLGAVRTHVKFATKPELSSVPSERWEVDLQYDMFEWGFAAYF